MIIPHSEKSVYSFRLPLGLVQAGCFLLVTLWIGLLVFINSYQDMLANMIELQELRLVNREQQEQIDFLAQETAVLQDSMKRLRDLDQQIRHMMKIGNDKAVGEGLGTGLETANQDGQGGPLPGEDGGLKADTATRRLHLGTSVSRGGLQQAREMAARLEQLKQEVPIREDSLEKLRGAIAEKQAYLAARPSIWPARGIITSTFGYRRSPFGWGREYHPGLDIAARAGTPVVATGDGVVTFSGWKGSYGRTVIIDHGYGFTTLYGHNQKNVVSVGQRVTKGQIIAYVGSSGRSTGPHVHYEIRLHDKLTNPRYYLSGR